MGSREARGKSGCFLRRGTDELLGVMDQVTIINSTLGKALGGASGAYRILSVGSPSLHAWPALYGAEKAGRANGGEGSMDDRRGLGQFLAPDWLLLHHFLSLGGYTTGPKPLVSLLRQRSRPYLFSNSLPPAVVGCASKALDLLMGSNTIVQSMAAKTRRYGAHRGGAEWERW